MKVFWLFRKLSVAIFCQNKLKKRKFNLFDIFIFLH
jgi:hypothetical protein